MPRVLSVFGVVIDIIFLNHGAVKLFGFPAGVAPGQVALFAIHGLAGVREFLGGVSMGDAAILYSFGFLYRALAGAGPWSLDALRRK